MKIKVKTYPQLHALCWNRPDDAIVEGAEALALYERNWRFVDEAALTKPERALLETLTANYGHGTLLVASGRKQRYSAFSATAKIGYLL